jgi:hypothetical protein
MNPSISRAETLYQQVRLGLERGAFRSPVGQAVARAVHLGVDDQVTRDLVADELRVLRQLEATGQLPPFCAAQGHAGEIDLGMDCYGQPIRLALRLLASGTLLAGNTGAGKTNFLKWLLPQVVAAKVPVWVTESHKTELRQLRHLI